MLRVAGLKSPACEEISPLIPKYVKEELGAVKHGTVSAHFLHCSRCAEEYHLQLEQTVVTGEVRLPGLKPDAIERASRRMKQLEAGISILWEEVKGKASRWAQEKREAIVETLQGLALLWQVPPRQHVVVRTRGAICTRGGTKGMKRIPAELLNSDLKPSGETIYFEVISKLQFTSEKNFHCELVTDNLSFEGRTVSLTIRSDDKPVVTFTAQLLKTEDEPGKFKALFSEDGFGEVTPSSVPHKNIRLHVLPV